MAEPIYPGREESPVGQPHQDKRVPATKRNDTQNDPAKRRDVFPTETIHRKRLPRTPDPVSYLPEQTGITGRTIRLHGRTIRRNRGHPPELGTYRETQQIPVTPFPYREWPIPRDEERRTKPGHQRTRGKFSRNLRA